MKNNNVKLWIAIVLLAIVVIFTVQNYTPVVVKLIIWDVHTSQAILIFATLLIGFIVGLLIGRRR